MNEVEHGDKVERNEIGERRRPIVKSPQDNDQRVSDNDRRVRKRRASDKKLHILRENWYRDVWLLVITIFILIVGIRLENVAGDLVSTRKTAVRDSCQADNAQADVLRAILDTSLAQQERLQKEGKTPPGALSKHDATVLLDHLLKPLGGFHPSKEQKEALCDRRVARGSPQSG